MVTVSVRLYGHPVGVLSAAPSGTLLFEYLPEWSRRAGSHPLSASLPIRPEPYLDDQAGPFFDGLLPDNLQIRQTLGNYLQIDAGDRYRLLEALGRECPGAVSILPLDAPVIAEDRLLPRFELLDDARLAQHIRDLPRRPLFVDADGELRLSLAGVQHKTALLQTRGGLALPREGTPTSHILKIDIDGLPDSARVEHFCLRLAAATGLDVPRSKIAMAEDQPYLLITRYDRLMTERGGRPILQRLHQEDFCQALGRYPRDKYEKDGGPGWAEAFQLVGRTFDSIDGSRRLLDRAVFQFLVGNPDAHAKNYSLVYRGDGLALSKLYDVNNAAAFRDRFKRQLPRLAMFIGGERDPDLLTPAHWDRFAVVVGIRPEVVRKVLQDMADRMPALARNLRNDLVGTVADSWRLDLVVDDIAQRCARVGRWFEPQEKGWANPREGQSAKPDHDMAPAKLQPVLVGSGPEAMKAAVRSLRELPDEVRRLREIVTRALANAPGTPAAVAQSAQRGLAALDSAGKPSKKRTVETGRDR